MSTHVFDKTVDTLQAALEHAFNQGARGKLKPERSDAVRLTWQLVDLATEGVRGQSHA